MNLTNDSKKTQINFKEIFFWAHVWCPWQVVLEHEKKKSALKEKAIKYNPLVHCGRVSWCQNITVQTCCKKCSFPLVLQNFSQSELPSCTTTFGGCSINNRNIQLFWGATSIIIMPNIYQVCSDVYAPVPFPAKKSFLWCIWHSRECIKIPFNKMRSLILSGWPSRHLLNQVSITFLMSSPPCHYVAQRSAPSHQLPAGFKAPP